LSERNIFGIAGHKIGLATPVRKVGFYHVKLDPRANAVDIFLAAIDGTKIPNPLFVIRPTEFIMIPELS
jgi:hypothetical protein